MRLQTYIILIFALSLIGYFMGYNAGIFTIWENMNGISPETFITSIASYITSQPLFAQVLGLGAVVLGAIALYTGFAAVYIIPLMICIPLLNLFIFPTSFFLDSSCTTIVSGAICEPEPIGLILLLFLNMLSVLAITEFVRGQV